MVEELVIVAATRQKFPAFNYSFRVLSFMTCGQLLSIILVDIVIFSVCFASWPNIDKVHHRRHWIDQLLLCRFVISSLKGVHFVFSLHIVTRQRNRVQIEFVFDVVEGLLELLSPFERVIQNLIDVLIINFTEICRRDYFLRAVLYHTQHFVAVWILQGFCLLF